MEGSALVPHYSPTMVKMTMMTTLIGMSAGNLPTGWPNLTGQSHY